MKRKQDNNPECAQRLDALMNELNIKAPTLAKLAHYSPQQINSLRRNSRSMTADAAHAIAPILGVRPEYLLCEDNCKTSEEIAETEYRNKLSEKLNLSIKIEILKLSSLVKENLETQNNNCIISNDDLGEFTEDISNYIQMRTEKWLLPRCKKKQNLNPNL